MIITKQLVTDFEIKTVKDLYKLKPLMEGTSLKINKSEIARELNVDRRMLKQDTKMVYLVLTYSLINKL